MPFHVEDQAQRLWCWAAVAVSVDHFFDPHSGSTQCAVVRDALGSVSSCSSADLNEAGSLLQALIRLRRPVERIGRALDFDEIREQTERLPVCAYIDWGDGSGHFVAIRGVRQTPTAQIVKIEDPDPGYPDRDLLYDEFVSSYRGVGVWRSSYVHGPWTGRR